MEIVARECMERPDTRARRLDQYLSQRGISRDAISQALDADPDDIIFVTGSIIDGVGDVQSDLDLFLLTSARGFERREASFDRERRSQQQRLGFGIIYAEIGGEALDAECHLADKYDSLLATLARLDPFSRDCLWENFRSLGPFERVEAVELLHRFRIGVPIHGAAAFEALYARFDEDKFLAWNGHFHLIEAEDFIKGVKRSLREGDAENAYLKLQRLFDSLADAKLFLEGASFDRWKWRLPKLRQIGDPGFLKLFLSIELGSGGDLQDRVVTGLDQAQQIHLRLFDRLGPRG